MGDTAQKIPQAILKNPPLFYGDARLAKREKIGVPWDFLKELADEPKKVFIDALEKLKELGAENVDVDLKILKTSLAVYYILATAEASTNLARFDGIRYGVRSSRAKTLDEVYDYSKEEGMAPK